MNRLTALLALVLIFPLAAHADEASRRAKSEELITLLHADRMSTQVTENVMQQTTAITTQKAGGTLSPETKTALADFQKKLVAVMEPQVGWKAIEPDYIRLYAAAFTDEELDGMLAFYKSAAGKALLEKMPDVNQQTGKILQSKFAALQPQLKQMLTDFESTVPPKASGPPTLTSPPPYLPTPPAPTTAPTLPPAKSTPQ
jgi:hypothetical protein